MLSFALVYLCNFQVVSGLLYELTVELIDTSCLRSENKERSLCEADNESGARRTCSVQIWDQPWLNSRKIEEASCSSGSEIEARSLKTVLPGHRENISLSPNDEEIKNAANFALSRLDAFDDNSKKRVLTGVVDASAHVRLKGKLECS